MQPFTKICSLFIPFPKFRNGHRKTVYVKLGLLVKTKLVEGGKVEKDLWHSSSEKAKTLKIDDFGTLESIREQARIIRTASNRREATEILKEIIKHGPYTSKSGLTSRIPGKSIGKLVSSEAVNASFIPEAHYLAVANLDKLFLNAIEPWIYELNPTKNNDGLKARHYLYAPMNFHERIIVVKFTVKEYINPELYNKTYSIEAIDTNIG